MKATTPVVLLLALSEMAFLLDTVGGLSSSVRGSSSAASLSSPPDSTASTKTTLTSSAVAKKCDNDNEQGVKGSVITSQPASPSLSAPPPPPGDLRMSLPNARGHGDGHGDGDGDIDSQWAWVESRRAKNLSGDNKRAGPGSFATSRGARDGGSSGGGGGFGGTIRTIRVALQPDRDTTFLDTVNRAVLSPVSVSVGKTYSATPSSLFPLTLTTPSVISYVS